MVGHQQAQSGGRQPEVSGHPEGKATGQGGPGEEEEVHRSAQQVHKAAQGRPPGPQPQQLPGTLQYTQQGQAAHRGENE